MPDNLYKVFETHFPDDRSSVLLTDASGEVMTYEQAEMGSARIANLLISSGLKRGDRVAVQVEKSPEMILLYLATLRAGLAFQPLNPAYTIDELEYFLADARPSMVVCDPSRELDLVALLERTSSAQVLTLNAEGNGTMTETAATHVEVFETVESQAGEMAALLYSSGTTGRPKGIMLSHRNLIENVRILVDYWGFRADDCLLHSLPIFHVHGLFVALGCVLMSGASMRWLPRFEPATVIETLPHCSVMMGVPTYYTRLLAMPSFDAKSCARVRLFISGSAPLLADTFEAFRERTGHTILERYGMTETGMNTSNPLEGERRPGTVGFALPGVEVRIIGEPESAAAIGEVGDLQVKGANVFSGYWNRPKKSMEDFTDDGFFSTGDKGVIDADGYISIVGRSRDMVISGGLNIYPREIELLIDQLPDVLESAVIGLPHADLGEALAAVLVLAPGTDLSAERIRQHLRDHAAGFKVPKKLIVVDQLPRNTMGKVQKNQLRADYAREFEVPFDAG